MRLWTVFFYDAECHFSADRKLTLRIAEQNHTYPPQGSNEFQRQHLYVPEREKTSYNHKWLKKLLILSFR